MLLSWFLPHHVVIIFLSFLSIILDIIVISGRHRPHNLKGQIDRIDHDQPTDISSARRFGQINLSG
ncbi:MAG: hypothetical protein ORN57_01425 [Alphaproteobacteria bacterium]|nr:hypothetical protein [Alphaproteobacteria bacterium]